MLRKVTLLAILIASMSTVGVAGNCYHLGGSFDWLSDNCTIQTSNLMCEQPEAAAFCSITVVSCLSENTWVTQVIDGCSQYQ